MIKILLSSFTLLTAFLTGVNIQAQNDTPALDLSIGNRWVYDAYTEIWTVQGGWKVTGPRTTDYQIIGDSTIDGQTYAVVRVRDPESKSNVRELWYADATTIGVYDSDFCNNNSDFCIDYEPSSGLIRTHWLENLPEECWVKDFPICEEEPSFNMSIGREGTNWWGGITYWGQRWTYGEELVGDATKTQYRLTHSEIGFLELVDDSSRVVRVEFDNRKVGKGSRQILQGAVIDGVLYGDTNTITSMVDPPYHTPVEEARGFHFFPNPVDVSTRYSFQIPADAGIGVGSGYFTIEVFDLTGRSMGIVAQHDFYSPKGANGILNLSSLVTGSYFAQLSFNGIPREQLLVHKL